MKNLLILLGLTLLSYCAIGQTSNDEDEIRQVMKDQTDAWNAYDLEGFMQGYWKSDQLKFYGSNGVTYGWENTLKRYKKAYPSKEYTGTLTFGLREISKIGDESYYIMGTYHLERTKGNAEGIFMIIFKKIDGQWKIIADTSC